MMNKIQLNELQEETDVIYAHYSTSDGPICLTKEWYRLLYNIYCKYGATDQGKYEKTKYQEVFTKVLYNRGEKMLSIRMSKFHVDMIFFQD